MYRVKISNKGDSSFIVKSEGHEFLVDTKGGGVPPPAVLLAGLGSCMGVYIRKYAEGARFDIGNFDMRLEAELSKEPPIRFAGIMVSIDFEKPVDERRKPSLAAFIKNCPVHNTLMAHPEITINFSKNHPLV